MNWFLQNSFLGCFLSGLGVAILLSLWFLLHEKGASG